MKTRKSFSSLLVYLIGLLITVNIGCTKENVKEKDSEPTEPYILSKVDPVVPIGTDYFVRMEFPNSELYYSLDDPSIDLLEAYSSGYGNMIGRGFAFVNKATEQRNAEESIAIMFYIHEGDSAFVFQTANYRYGNPWNSLSGANVEFSTPANQPSAYYLYLGTNAENVYFRITWYDKNHICGQFQTKLVGCCVSDITFWVKGEFSIPRVNY